MRELTMELTTESAREGTTLPAALLGGSWYVGSTKGASAAAAALRERDSMLNLVSVSWQCSSNIWQSSLVRCFKSFSSRSASACSRCNHRAPISWTLAATGVPNCLLSSSVKERSRLLRLIWLSLCVSSSTDSLWSSCFVASSNWATCCRTAWAPSPSLCQEATWLVLSMLSPRAVMQSTLVSCCCTSVSFKTCSLASSSFEASTANAATMECRLCMESSIIRCIRPVS
mmetsp:Transcript_27350/g.53470  ORF Transcript_27350/g.53470 Transcript_27350/m.53470 type:complete len:229 (-) Transcript_27350:177-863(-)